MFHVGEPLRGAVDTVCGQGVATQFVAFDYMPLVPTKSWFITKRGPGRKFTGMRVPFSAKSILFTYVVWWGGALGVAGAIFAGSNLDGDASALKWLFMCVGWAAVVFGPVRWLLSRVPARRRAQRETLHKLLGLSALPSMLYARDCAGPRGTLRTMLDALQIPIELKRMEAYSLSPEMAPFVFAWALYGDRVEPGAGWAAIAEKAWTYVQENQVSRPKAEENPDDNDGANKMFVAGRSAAAGRQPAEV